MRVRSLFTSATLLGFSIGGFFDGIVLHQILGWHHMICRTETCQVDSVDLLRRQNTEDGWFHFTLWVLTVLGIWGIARRPVPFTRKELVASILLGWGSFHFFEGLIDHELLGIHHVYPRSTHYILYDMLFLISGLLGMVAGAMMLNRRNARGGGV